MTARNRVDPVSLPVTRAAIRMNSARAVGQSECAVLRRQSVARCSRSHGRPELGAGACAAILYSSLAREPALGYRAFVCVGQTRGELGAGAIMKHRRIFGVLCALSLGVRRGGYRRGGRPGRCRPIGDSDDPAPTGTYTVPEGVCQVDITAYGGSGGPRLRSGATAGGDGGGVEGTFTVSPGRHARRLRRRARQPPATVTAGSTRQSTPVESATTPVVTATAPVAAAAVRPRCTTSTSSPLIVAGGGGGGRTTRHRPRQGGR